MANVGACWARAGTRLMQHSRGGESEWTATVRGGAVSGRTENGGVVLSPVTGEHQARADGWRRTDEGAFKRKGAGAKAATAAAAAATATGGGNGGTRRAGRDGGKTSGVARDGERERRGETPASVEGSLASEAGVARTRRREGKRKDRERGGGVGGRELENERATLLRESRKVASPAAYAVRSFSSSSFSFYFFPVGVTGGLRSSAS